MRICLLVIYLAACATASSQMHIQGKVTNQDGQPLAFVNIGFVGTPIGTVSDRQGNFELNFEKDAIGTGDTLRFSMIGYRPCVIPASGLKACLEVSLCETPLELKELVVISKSLQKKRLGKLHTSVLNMSCNFALNEIANQNLGSEIGRKFNIKNKNTFLDTLHFFIKHNNYDTVCFRINIYNISKNQPKANIMDQSLVLVLVGQQIGWIKIDLTKHQIRIHQDVIISLEWVQKSQSGSLLSLPISMPTPYTHYYKYGSQNQWKAFRSMATKMLLDVRY